MDLSNVFGQFLYDKLNETKLRDNFKCKKKLKKWNKVKTKYTQGTNRLMQDPCRNKRPLKSL